MPGGGWVMASGVWLGHKPATAWGNRPPPANRRPRHSREPHLHNLPEQAAPQKQTEQVKSNEPGRLLALVDALNDETLDDSQRQLVTRLRSGILALG